LISFKRLEKGAVAQKLSTVGLELGKVQCSPVPVVSLTAGGDRQLGAACAQPIIEIIEISLCLGELTSRNVTRWRSGEMILRWTAVGLLHAEQGFRRIRGYRHLPLLKRALCEQPAKLDSAEEAA
jgi:hypothetical protein